MPKLTYALPVWCWVDTTTAKALDTTIQRAARIVLHKQNAILDNSTYEATGLLPFHLMSQFKSLNCVHNYLSKPNYEAVLPALLSDSHSQQTTRSVTCRKFCVPAHSTSANEHCFYYTQQLCSGTIYPLIYHCLNQCLFLRLTLLSTF